MSCSVYARPLEMKYSCALLSDLPFFYKFWLPEKHTQSVELAEDLQIRKIFTDVFIDFDIPAELGVRFWSSSVIYDAAKYKSY